MGERSFRRESRPIQEATTQPVNKEEETSKNLLEEVFFIEHPEIPEAIRGLEGMKTADEILKGQQQSGVLIGGLADQIWRQYNSPKALDGHKDVDVLILSGTVTRMSGKWNKFLGGIDWWEPATWREGTVWVNGFGITLMFGLGTEKQLEPGLYLPKYEYSIDVKISEAEYLAKYRDLTVDKKFIESWRSKELEPFSQNLDSVVAGHFKERVLELPPLKIIDQSSIPSLDRFYNRK